MKYAIVYEKTNTGYSAYVPDLPGCIDTGTSFELTKRRMEKAVEKHLAAMHADGDPIPEPVTEVAYIETPNFTASPRRQRRTAFVEKIALSAERR